MFLSTLYTLTRPKHCVQSRVQDALVALVPIGGGPQPHRVPPLERALAMHTHIHHLLYQNTKNKNLTTVSASTLKIPFRLCDITYN
jgi:hypothetical protein